MRIILLFLVCLIEMPLAWGQDYPDKIIIAAAQYRDWHHHFLRIRLEGTRVRRKIQGVEFNIDAARKKLICINYETVQFSSLNKGDKNTRKRKCHRKRMHCFSMPLAEFDSLNQWLFHPRDTVANCPLTVVSHFQYTIHLLLIYGNDTISVGNYPIFSNCWQTDSISTKNPAIDKLIYDWLPRRFVGRERLLLKPKEDDEYW